MSFSIHTNIPSIIARSNMNSLYDAMNTNVERLSSGKRINSASDDPSGIGMVSRMTNMIGAFDGAQQNISMATSIAQTAEDGMDSATDILQRMRELAVEANKSTYTTADRATLDAELQTLVEELDKLSSQTVFNSNKLLDGSFANKTFQVGGDSSDTLSISINSIATKQLGVSNQAAISAVGNGEAIASGDLTINGTAIGASLASYDTASSTAKTFSAISKAGAINAVSSTTGVTATVNSNQAHGSAMTAAANPGAIHINGVSIAVTVTSDTTASRAAVVTAINNSTGQTGVVATDTNSSGTGVTLAASDGRNIDVAFTTVTSASTGVSSGTHYGSYTLTSSSTITIARGSNNEANDIDNSGLREGSYATQTAGLSSKANQQSAWTAGALTINSYQVRETSGADDGLSYWGQDKSSIAKAAAINAITANTGVTATADATKVDGANMSNTSAITNTITINNVATASITTDASDEATTRTAVADAINAITGQTGVTATNTNADTTGVQLTASDGRNISVVFGGSLTSIATGVSSGNHTGSFTLSSAAAIDIGTTDPANFDSKVTDISNTGSYGSGSTGKALNTIDVTTLTNAATAQTAIDNAINQVGESRSELGATINRLDYKVTSLTSLSDNYKYARSGLEDADFAKESTELAKNQLISNAAFAMVAQANQIPGVVMKLLE